VLRPDQHSLVDPPSDRHRDIGLLFADPIGAACVQCLQEPLRPPHILERTPDYIARQVVGSGEEQAEEQRTVSTVGHDRCEQGQGAGNRIGCGHRDVGVDLLDRIPKPDRREGDHGAGCAAEAELESN
jgi:hypothetical protein